MNLPIYQQTLRDIPIHDEPQPITPPRPSRWDTYGAFLVLGLFVLMLAGIGFMALTGVRP